MKTATTRNDFLSKLWAGLSKLSPEDANQAMGYYTEYFDDAGLENEQQVLEELGDPSRIAAQVTAESMLKGLEDPKAKKGLSAIWIAILAVFASPIAMPITIAIFAVVLALVICVITLLLAFFAVALSLFVVGAVGLVVGITGAFIDFPVGMFSFGIGCFGIGAGVLSGMGLVSLTRVIFAGIVKMVSRRVEKGRKK